MHFPLFLARSVLCLLIGWILSTGFVMTPAFAGVTTKPDLEKRFPAPFMVGEKEAELPVWPIFKKNMTSTDLVAYVFESIDYVSIPGFSGVPMNLLVALDPKGNFLEVQVLSHHEPVFLEGLGEAPLFQFVSQYKDLSLKQNIKIVANANNGIKKEEANAYIDGVAKATASLKILNQSVLSAALNVARKKLGFAEGRDPDLIARIKPDLFEPYTARQLAERDLIQRAVMTNAQVEKLFAGTVVEGVDAQALERPAETFVDLRASYVSVPTVGRNLLGEAGWNKLKGRLEPGDHAIMITSTGRYGVVDENFIRGSIPDRLALKQGSLPIELRDLDLDVRPPGMAPTDLESFKIFRVISQSGLDPALPLEFYLHITREKGIVYPERISKDFRFNLVLPERYYVAAEADNKGWVSMWQDRWWELAILAAGLLVLSVALAFQKKLTANGNRFRWFRTGFLLFTIFFIGWYAQGQLSIINLTGAVQALAQGRGLSFFLYDPMTVSIWAFVLVSLVLWGRGTFCGWLCPFGALQEVTGKLGRVMNIPQIRIKAATDARLKWLKYVVLAVILGSAVVSTQLTDKLVEVEPFKTAITLNFVRSWPFVLYAGLLLAASAVVYKFFCRYLCPLGAGLAIMGRFRLLNWIPRRTACGTPCQTCRYSCDYQAIEPSGNVRYDECFQCMDCVVIHESDEKCAPLMLEKKRARAIPITALVQAG
jgi:NosR/NirI family nitrous oxide reductase transcriptional regulator